MQTGKAERTRNLIISCAAEIFNKKGYAGTSVQDIISASGLSKGSLYANFENKEDIALEVFDYNYGLVQKHICDKMNLSKSYKSKLMVYAKVYKNITRGNVIHGGCPIQNTATEADDTNILLKDKAALAVVTWERNVTELIENGIIAGEFVPGVDIRQTALSIMSLIEGGLMLSRVTNDASKMDAALSSVDRIINDLGFKN